MVRKERRRVEGTREDRNGEERRRGGGISRLRERWREWKVGGERKGGSVILRLIKMLIL